MNQPKLFSPKRTIVIAANTFTQLVRMKVFYFLAAFALILIGANFFQLPFSEGPDSSAEQALTQLKSWSMGAMTLFSTIFAIVGTSLLLPRDVEDRTLYTILAKPVPRLDYLAGKLLGILFLIFTSLVIMDILTVGVLQFRLSGLVAEQTQRLTTLGVDPADIKTVTDQLAVQGPTWVMQAGILAIFLKATVISAVALMISTFSTSTLFTVVMSSLVYFIGHVQADAREFYSQQTEGVTWLSKGFAGLISLVFPDFQLYNVIDSAINGLAITGEIMLKLGGITLLYAAIYTVVSWFIFADKEF